MPASGVRDNFLAFHEGGIRSGVDYEPELFSFPSEEREDLAVALLKNYQDWRPDGRRSGHTIEIFAPSIFMTATRQAGMPRIAIIDSYRETIDRWISGLLHLCLYADRVWVPDPAEILAWQIVTAGYPDSIAVHEPLIKNQSILLGTLKAFEDLTPLIDSGVIAIYPALTCYRRQTSIELFGEVRGFALGELRNAWPELYVAEGLSYARIFDASYTALYRDEHAALEQAAIALDQSLGLTDRKTLVSLRQMTLPSFQHLDAESLVAVRRNESSFDDFRRLMRETTAKLAGGVEDPAFVREVGRLEKEELEPALEKLRKDLVGITTLKERLSDFGIDFSSGALAGLVIKGDLLDSILAGAASALSKALAKTIAKSTKVRPAASVVYTFETGRTAFPGLKGSAAAWLYSINHNVRFRFNHSHLKDEF